MNEVQKNGDYFFNQLTSLKNEFPKDIKELRGKGYMIGVEHFYDCNNLVEKFRDKGVLVNCTNQNVVRILPPLISEKDHIDFFISKYREILKEKN